MITRRQANALLAGCLALPLTMTGGSAALAQAQATTPGAQPPGTFVRPGMLYSADNLEQMRQSASAGSGLAFGAWQRLQQDPLASLAFVPKPAAVVYRNAPSNSGNLDLQRSASAALLHALQWNAAGDPRYAAKALQILDGWSAVLTSIQGRDAQLAAALYGYKLLNAAEILRSGGADWPQASQDRFTRVMVDVFSPHTREPGHVNGGWANGNWDAAAVLFNQHLAVWTEDHQMYADAVAYFRDGYGNGSVEHYVQDPETGQVQESGRDQSHTQTGLGLLVAVAQSGWNQRAVNPDWGTLAGHPDGTNRLLKGLEYTAKFNIGLDVPYTPMAGVGYTLAQVMQNNSWMAGPDIAQENRGQLGAMWYSAYRLFHDCAGLPDSAMPYTRQVLDRLDAFESAALDFPSYGAFTASSTNRPGHGPRALERAGHTTVSLRNQASNPKWGADARVVRVSGGSAPVVGATSPDLEALFDLEYLGTKDHYALRSLATGGYLSVVDSATGTLSAQAATAGRSETFRVFHDAFRTIIQSTATGKYLTCTAAEGEVRAGASSYSADAAKWILLYPQDPGSSLTSLGETVTAFHGSGLIRHSGIAEELRNKLAAGDLEGFRALLAAQPAQMIASAAAVWLLRNAFFLAPTS